MLGSLNASIGGVVATGRAGRGSVEGTWRDLGSRHYGDNGRGLG